MQNKLVELVNHWGRYEQDDPGMSISDFCLRYLAEQARPPDEPAWAQEIPIDGRLAGLIGRVGRFAEVYSKKAVEKVGLSNIDDWVYLICLLEMGAPTKSELIYRMLSEFPTGIDVIKRLVKKGLVEEFPDPDDKRSKRVKLTEKGAALLIESLPLMKKVGQMAFGTMRDAEKAILLNVLTRLDQFHDGHFKNLRLGSFEEAFEVLTQQKYF